MELTEQVKISLDDAEKDLREALAFAAKTEDPRVNIAIAQILEATQQVKKYYDRPKNPMEDMFRRHFGEF